jgi:hypothetical protein
MLEKPIPVLESTTSSLCGLPSSYSNDSRMMLSV